MAGFGVSIADVGDLDGDGFSDVVVGANSSMAGRAPRTSSAAPRAGPRHCPRPG
ncbi:MAG: FG-GAP repeat protein [Deltaproteobacteria bacterium]|nr:FG-GAP repeat protein [Deltaproteobacteria bacterium]